MGTRQNRLGDAVLTSTHKLCFEQKFEKYRDFFLKIFIFLLLKYSILVKYSNFSIFERACIHNVRRRKDEEHTMTKETQRIPPTHKEKKEATDKPPWKGQKKKLLVRTAVF